MSRYLSSWIDDKAGCYLDRLIETGLHGEDEPTVVGNLVMQGIRQAVADGFIPAIPFGQIEAALSDRVQPAPKWACAICEDGDLCPLDKNYGDTCDGCGAEIKLPF